MKTALQKCGFILMSDMLVCISELMYSSTRPISFDLLCHSCILRTKETGVWTGSGRPRRGEKCIWESVIKKKMVIEVCFTIHWLATRFLWFNLASVAFLIIRKSSWRLQLWVEMIDCLCGPCDGRYSGGSKRIMRVALWVIGVRGQKAVKYELSGFRQGRELEG